MYVVALELVVEGGGDRSKSAFKVFLLVEVAEEPALHQGVALEPAACHQNQDYAHQQDQEYGPG